MPIKKNATVRKKAVCPFCKSRLCDIIRQEGADGEKPPANIFMGVKCGKCGKQILLSLKNKLTYQNH